MKAELLNNPKKNAVTGRKTIYIRRSLNSKFLRIFFQLFLVFFCFRISSSDNCDESSIENSLAREFECLNFQLVDKGYGLVDPKFCNDLQLHEGDLKEDLIHKEIQRTPINLRQWAEKSQFYTNVVKLLNKRLKDISRVNPLIQQKLSNGKTGFYTAHRDRYIAYEQEFVTLLQETSKVELLVMKAIISKNSNSHSLIKRFSSFTIDHSEIRFDFEKYTDEIFKMKIYFCSIRNLYMNDKKKLINDISNYIQLCLTEKDYYLEENVTFCEGF